SSMAGPGRLLWTYAGPILLILGIIGNILSIIILLRKSLRRLSWSLYLVTLAISDILVLCTTTFDYWMRMWKNIHVYTFSAAGCKIENFLTYFSVHFSAWILVAVTLERLLFLYWPLRARILFTRKVAAIIIAIIAAALTLVNMHIFWNFQLTCRRRRCACRPLGDGFVWSIIDLCMSTLIPFIIIAICNGFFVKKLLFLRSTTHSTSEAYKQKARATSIMMLSITMTFIILNLPITIVICLNNTTLKEDPVLRLALGKAWVFTVFLHQLNSIVNVVLYYLSNSRFQKEVKTILCGNKVSPVSIVTTDGI
ncbi:unnamed protein product, partial [Owenia fusiformis]